MFRPVRYAIFVLAVGVAFTLAGWAGTRFYLKHQFVSLLEDLRMLDASKNPTALSVELMRKYEKHSSGTWSETNYRAKSFLFRNRSLSKFRLAPASEIEITFEQEGSSLRNVAVVYTSSVFKENSPIIRLSEVFCSDPADHFCQHFAMNPHGRNIDQTWNADVSFGHLAKPEIRSEGWSLNPDCFVKIAGCKNVSELLPTLWKATPEGTVSSRMRSDSDSIAEASQPLAQ